MEYVHKLVKIFTDDTDVLCIFLHHLYPIWYNSYVYIKNITWKKDTEIQPCYHIKDITNASQNVKLLCVRFCHAFTGGDTTSSIHMFEKTFILSKTESSKKVRDIANQSYLEDMPVEVIGNVRFFDLLNSSSNTLQQFRKYKYNGMVAAYH